MILVDTSVLIDYLKGRENDKSNLFQIILNRNLPYGITNLIFLEVLQGAKSKREFNKIKKYLETIVFYDLKNGKESYEKIAELNLYCRKSGITVRSTIDLIIAQIAIENELSLLHNDRDFDNISSVVSELRILEWPESL